MKTVIQGIKTEKTPSQLSVFNTIINENGTKGLFKGISPTLVRGFLVNGIVFYSNEMFHKYLNRLV